MTAQGFRPKTVEDAVQLLAEHPTAVPIAGCTDLMVVSQATGRRLDHVVDVTAIPALREIKLTEGQLHIGAAATFTEIRRHPEVQRSVPALAAAAATIGGWQIQNRATIGGNVANASPAGDSPPVLLALDASLDIVSREGVRTLPYAAFHEDYRKTALGAGELLACLRIPIPAPRHQGFRKIGTREAQAISKVVVAFATHVEDGLLRRVRLAAGSVAATPIRLIETESKIEGQPLDAVAADAAADAARTEVQPIDDVRSTGGYRRWALGNVVRRLILDAASRFQNG